MSSNRDREEKRRMTAVFGVFAGILTGCLIYVLLVHSFEYSSLVSGVIVALVTVPMCAALVLWSAFRCIMALMLPNFFTSKGRSVIISIVLSLLLSGPVQNITNNSRETGSSMACIAEMVLNQTKALRQQLPEHMLQIAQRAENNKIKLADAQKGITDAIDTVMKHFNLMEQEMNSQMNVKGHLQMNVKHETCASLVQALKEECENDRRLVHVCSSLNIKMCTTKTGDDFSAAVSKMRNVFNRVKRYFKADVVIHGNFDTVSNSSKNVDSIRADIDRDINNTVDTFKQFTSVTKKILSLTLLLMFLQAFCYFRNYITRVRHDNIYITKAFVELDETKAKLGQTPLLPLKKRELSKYIVTGSFKLTLEEITYCKKGVIQALILVLLGIILVVSDYCLYYLLNLVKRFGSLSITVKAKSGLKFAVKGSGPIACFYRIFLEDVDVYKHYLNAIDVGKCLPKPTEPSTEYNITVFVVIYAVLICVVIMRAYGMRLRRNIAAYFYPEQETQRLDYLYSVIKYGRQAHRQFVRQEVNSAHKERKMKEIFRFSTWLKSRFPCCRMCALAHENMHCISCQNADPNVLTTCKGVINGAVCTAVYCEECKGMLNDVCPLCDKDEVQLTLIDVHIP